MIHIFHGDDQAKSRDSYHQFLDKLKNYDIFRADSKSLDFNQINNFLQGSSLFPGQKIICFDNFFSLSKSNIDKLIKLINHSSTDIVIWQDKALTATQLKIFPQAKVNYFRADNQIFACLNSLKPHNLPRFTNLYDQVIAADLFDLFLYLLKAKFRKLLTLPSTSDQNTFKKIYLQVIELEFQYKTGQLPLPKDIALLRTLTPLLR